MCHRAVIFVGNIRDQGAGVWARLQALVSLAEEEPEVRAIPLGACCEDVSLQLCRFE